MHHKRQQIKHIKQMIKIFCKSMYIFYIFTINKNTQVKSTYATSKSTPNPLSLSQLDA